jgi:hypothetical protein
MHALPYELRFGLKAHLGPAGALFGQQSAPVTSSFFNGVFFLAVAIAAICTFADWALSKEQKHSIKERVGDYWTALQYSPLDVLFRSAWHRAVSLILVLIGNRPWSRRRLLVPPLLHLLLSYLTWWYAMRLLFQSKGWDFGPIHHPGMRINLISVSASLYVPFFVWLTIVSWVGWSGFASILSRPSWTGNAVMRTIAIYSGIMIFILTFTVLTLLLYMSPDEIIASVKLEFPQLELHGFEGKVTVHSGNGEVTDTILAALAKAILGVGEAYQTFLRKFLWFAFKISLFCLSIGPVICLFILFIVGVAGDLFLKFSRPVLQPITSLVLARLYESNNGVLAQLGVFIGAVIKLIDEGMKRLL